MSRIVRIIPLGTLSAALIVSAGAWQQSDNTSKNKRDRAEGSVTAGQQSQDTADIELARKIRKDIVSDKSLSTYAHNAKVIVRGGSVVLRGPVRSDSEKAKLAEIAMRHAGGSAVTNQLEVAPNKN